MTDGILVVGEALIDIVHDRDGRTTERVGGSPLNVAVGLGRLGHRVQLHTALGADARGDAIRAHLVASRVEIAATGIEATSTAAAEIAADGSASYRFDIAWDPSLQAMGAAARIVHTGSLGAALAPGDDAVLAFIRTRRAHALISFDPNIRPDLMRPRPEQLRRTECFFAQSDVVKLSDEDASWLYPKLTLDDVICRILSLGPALVAVTRGADGALLRTLEAESVQVSDAFGVVDTIGAGDSFMAGVLDAIVPVLRDEPIASFRASGLGVAVLAGVGARATACSAITVRRQGADLPWADELAAGIERP